MASVEKFYPDAQSTVIKAFEGANQSAAYDPGDLLQFHADGNVVVASAAHNDAIAIEHPSGTTNYVTEVELIDPTTVYVMRVATGTTLTQALIGDSMVITYTAGGHTVATGNGDVYCVGLLDPVGTDAGRVLVRFETAIFVGTGG